MYTSNKTKQKYFFLYFPVGLLTLKGRTWLTCNKFTNKFDVWSFFSLSESNQNAEYHPLVGLVIDNKDSNNVLLLTTL